MTFENATIRALYSAGISPGATGFRYLMDAVRLCYENPDKYSQMTKELYPAIAKLHDVTPASVERAMRTCRAKIKSGCTTNRDFIFAVIWFLRQLPDIE